MIGLGLRITSGAVRNALPGIALPALTLTGGTVDSPLQPQLNTSAFTLENGAVDTHASTDWQIATDAAFANVVWSALGSLGLTQITVGLALNETAAYYARARHNGANYQSKYSTAVMFNTLTISVTIPAITSPTAAAIGIGETPTITSSAFAVTNGTDAHASSDWQIAADAGFTNIVVQSLTDATNKTSWTTPAGNLLVSTGYFVRVRHNGTAQGASTWSPAISFTTAAAFANPWDLTNAAYANKSASVAAQDGTVFGVSFSVDGTKMYIVGTNTDSIYQYTLATAWDVATASYASKSASITAQDLGPSDLAFSSDGSKMYMVGSTNDKVFQYTLSTPWDVSTASYASKSLSVSAQDSNPHGMTFSTDGTKMYISGLTNDKVFQYTLTVAWDLATASYASKSFSITAQENNSTGVYFSNDGTKVFIIGNVNNTVYQYTLSTPWDVSTASYDSISFSVSTQTTLSGGLSFSADGNTMYVAGYDNDAVYQYSL